MFIKRKAHNLFTKSIKEAIRKHKVMKPVERKVEVQVGEKEIVKIAQVVEDPIIETPVEEPVKAKKTTKGKKE